MAIQDNYWTIGNEAVAWGTKAATLTRGIENQSDDVTPNVEWLVSRGMRPGALATPVGRSVAKQRGGTIVLTLDLLSKSLGLVLGSYGSTVATTTPGGATLARLHTITPTSAGVTRSATIHAGRYDIDGTARRHNYLGCMGTELMFSQAVKGNASVKATYNYKTEDTSALSVSPAYPSDPTIYSDLDCTVTVDGGTECQRQFDLTIPTGLDIARDRVCPGGREKPILAGRVEPTGNLSIDYPDDTFYAKYLSGEEVSLVIAYQGALIEDTTYESLTITIPAIQFTGSSPKVALDALPEQPLPFRVLDNGTDPIWKIEIVNTDTTV